MEKRSWMPDYNSAKEKYFENVSLVNRIMECLKRGVEDDSDFRHMRLEVKKILQDAGREDLEKNILRRISQKEEHFQDTKDMNEADAHWKGDEDDEPSGEYNPDDIKRYLEDALGITEATTRKE